MCTGSVLADKQEDAVQGVSYQIGSSRYRDGSYVHGVLHREGEGANPAEGLKRTISCATCIRAPRTRIVLMNVPERLQRDLKIKALQDGVFISGITQADQHDKIEFLDGSKFLLSRFADQGITLSLAPAVAEVPAKTHSVEPAERVLEDA